jgi:hypothetical protein
VDEIHTSPLRAKANQRTTSIRPGCCRVKNSNLPSDTANLFVSKVLPLALETVGILGPWECPCNKDILIMWHLVFGSQNDHPIADSNYKGDLFVVVKSLVRHAVLLFTHHVTHYHLPRSSGVSRHGFTDLLWLLKRLLLSSLNARTKPHSRRRPILSSFSLGTRMIY